MTDPNRLSTETLPSNRRVVSIDIDALERAFEYIASEAELGFGEPTLYFLNVTTGKLVFVEGEGALPEGGVDENFLELPRHFEWNLDYDAMEEFIDTVEDESVRNKLARAIRGKGAFRRFRSLVFDGGNVELKYAWSWFETRRRRERIVEWLEDCNIEPKWGQDIFQPLSLPSKRPALLVAVLKFVQDARDLPGVRRIALLGSLTTDKAIPKDVDLLVEVSDDEPLDRLAKMGRQLRSRAAETGDLCGADVFLCDSKGTYLGRTCRWKKCAPGIRSSCPAQHCGRRSFLCDDLQDFELKPSLLTAPPLELWPKWIERVELPEDVRTELAALRESV